MKLINMLHIMLENILTQGVWTLYDALVILNANEQKRIVTERQWIWGGTSELIQPIYFRDTLASEWKIYCLIGEVVFQR